MKKFKQLICLMLVGVFLFALMSGLAMAKNTKTNWYDEAMTAGVANGLFSGTESGLQPKANLTRAQMAAVINRAFGSTDLADIKAYKDVSAKAWYYEDMAKAVGMKTLEGYINTLSPDAFVTRQEVFTVLGRAFGLKDTDDAVLKGFADQEDIDQWAKPGIIAMVKAGYIQGSDGKLNSTALVTRAEFAQVLNKMVKTYIKTSGVYEQNITGNAVVNLSGVTLQDIKIEGNLIIADGVGSGEIVLNDVSVGGNVLVRGGGVNSIKINGNSQIGNIVVAKPQGAVRVAAGYGSKVTNLVVADGAKDVVLEGSIDKVCIVSAAPVVMQNAKIQSVELNSVAGNVTVAKTATVETVTVPQTAKDSKISVAGTVSNIKTAASGTTLAVSGAVKNVEASKTAENTAITADKGATISNVLSEGAKTSISGSGKVDNATIKGDNSSVDTNGTKVEVDKGVSGTTSNGSNVAGGSSGTTSGNGSVIPPSSGSSGGGSSLPKPQETNGNGLLFVDQVGGDDEAATLTSGKFKTIQKAIDVAAEGNTIKVLAGIYQIDGIVIDKPLKVLGPNADINPNTGIRVAEAVLLTTKNTKVTDYKYSEAIVAITCPNVVFDGFTVDGDNPNADGEYNINTAVYGNTCGTEQLKQPPLENLQITNNIIKNVFYGGVVLDGNNAKYVTNAPSKLNLIANNLMDNIWDNENPGYGQGISLTWNTPCSIQDNVISRVRQGIQINEFTNFYTGSEKPRVSGNSITTRRVGIWFNQQEAKARGWDIVDNYVAVQPGAEITRLYGIQFTSGSSAETYLVAGNSIEGFLNGIFIWNNNMAGVEVVGGTIADCENAIAIGYLHASYGKATKEACLYVSQPPVFDNNITKYYVSNSNLADNKAYKLIIKWYQDFDNNDVKQEGVNVAIKITGQEIPKPPETENAEQKEDKKATEDKADAKTPGEEVLESPSQEVSELPQV